MDQVAPPPIQQTAHLRISRPRPSSSLRTSELRPSCPNRNGDALIAVPDGARTALLSGLRARIAALENTHTSPHSDNAVGSACLSGTPPAASTWTFGALELDARLAGGLDANALHEIKPEEPLATGGAFGNWAAALGFAARLAVRRLQALSPSGPAQVLWCCSSALAHEVGLPYGRGLAALGLAPASCLIVETARGADTLWAMEEGLRSQSLALVIGIMPEVALTPARRLSLSAAGHATPCLLLTDPRTPTTGAIATRWRIGVHPSAAHPFDAGAPGASRYAVSLERCRQDRLTLQALSLLLEWSDETHRFRVAPSVAGRALAPRYAERSAG